MSAARVLINLCSIVVFSAFLLGLSWRLTAVAAAGAIALFLALHLLSGRARRLGSHAREVNQDLAARTLVVLQGMRTIRAFALEQHTRRSSSAPPRRRAPPAWRWSGCMR